MKKLFWIILAMMLVVIATRVVYPPSLVVSSQEAVAAKAAVEAAIPIIRQYAADNGHLPCDLSALAKVDLRAIQAGGSVLPVDHGYEFYVRTGNGTGIHTYLLKDRGTDVAEWSRCDATFSCPAKFRSEWYENSCRGNRTESSSVNKSTKKD